MTNRNFVPVLAVLCGFLVCPPTLRAEPEPEVESPTQVLRGQTMGTLYMVKIFGDVQRQQIALAVDAELRRVNDQMSTYLKSSEISQFNVSQSTDWFEVSADTAKVVDYAQQVAKKTGGAFDVTVGPLVNAWSFGPDPRTNQIPSDRQLKLLRESVGYQKLQVRLDPPAIRKSIPELKVDLSAIAKGHGVDRVVNLLAGKGIKNVFVEIGGEVRTSGDKAGEPWKVGIQMPDEATESAMIAHPMGPDESMATSGDYRINFEVDGKRYSHTIDPRTGKPIEHQLASVSVVADSCMAADAWATAINVLGPDAGLEAATRESLDALLILRTDEGYELAGTGTLAKYAKPAVTISVVGETTVEKLEQNNGLLPVMLLTMGVLGVLLCAMAVGVIFGRKPIAGSCGGLNNQTSEDGSVSCSLCSNPADACQELREKMQGKP